MQNPQRCVHFTVPNFTCKLLISHLFCYLAWYFIPTLVLSQQYYPANAYCSLGLFSLRILYFHSRKRQCIFPFQCDFCPASNEVETQIFDQHDEIIYPKSAANMPPAMHFQHKTPWDTHSLLHCSQLSAIVPVNMKSNTTSHKYYCIFSQFLAHQFIDFNRIYRFQTTPGFSSLSSPSYL